MTRAVPPLAIATISRTQLARDRLIDETVEEMENVSSQEHYHRFEIQRFQERSRVVPRFREISSWITRPCIPFNQLAL